jgi:hypothetical protein
MTKKKSKSPDLTAIVVNDTAIGGRIVLDKYLDQGADGLVFRGHYADSPDYCVAIKFYVVIAQPSLMHPSTKRTVPTSWIDDLRTRHASEFQRLRRVSHPNVQRYICSGTHKHSKPFLTFLEHYKAVVKPDEETPFIVSRFISGTRLDTHLRQSEIAGQIPSYLLGAATGLE